MPVPELPEVVAPASARPMQQLCTLAPRQAPGFAAASRVCARAGVLAAPPPRGSNRSWVRRNTDCCTRVCAAAQHAEHTDAAAPPSPLLGGHAPFCTQLHNNRTTVNSEPPPPPKGDPSYLPQAPAPRAQSLLRLGSLPNPAVVIQPVATSHRPAGRL